MTLLQQIYAARRDAYCLDLIAAGEERDGRKRMARRTRDAAAHWRTVARDLLAAAKQARKNEMTILGKWDPIPTRQAEARLRRRAR